jgi:hypothetical protein
MNNVFNGRTTGNRNRRFKILKNKGRASHKKAKTYGRNNGTEIIKSFRKKDSILIFGKRRRRPESHIILEMC